MTLPDFSHIAIIGLGQMGASLGLALKAGGVTAHITGFDPNPHHELTALSQHSVDSVEPTDALTVRGAELVIICAPVGAYASIAHNIAPHLAQGVLITDIGSIKAQAIADVMPHLPAHACFVPSHPVAGSEKTGPAHARSNFFERKLFLITPQDDTLPEAIDIIAALWNATGANVEVLPPELHDQIYALMSHLPQLMAFAAMPLLHAQGANLHADDTLYARFIRIGRSDPIMWRDVFLNNADHMLATAAQVQHIVQHMRDELVLGSAGNTETVDASERSYLLKNAWPRMLASSLIVAAELYESGLGTRIARFAAGGFTDFTSPAMQPPEDDMHRVSKGATLMIEWLNDYLARHTAIMTAIETRDADGLLQLLSDCQRDGLALLSASH